ncbi:MAG: hypothetical protein ACR2OV_09160 [Hyphomicrobiaceae bacterium]
MARFAWMLAIALPFLSPVLATPASSCGPQVRVIYVEASPDFFRVEFVEGTGFELTTLILDLATSAGRAYVDTAYDSRSAEKQNGVELDPATRVADGDQRLILRFRNFRVGLRFNYFADLDDQYSPSDRDMDHLTGGEMSGATAVAKLVREDGGPEVVAGRFNAKGTALLAPKACV